MHTCIRLYKPARTYTYIHTCIRTYIYIYIYIYIVFTQLKINKYADKSKSYKFIRIKLQVYETVIRQLNWQITKMYKQKALKQKIDKNDTYYTFKMKLV